MSDRDNYLLAGPSPAPVLDASAVRPGNRENPVCVGINQETGDPLYIAANDFFQGTYIVGTTGSGKTSLMTSIALQRIAAGESVIVLDPTSKGGMIHNIISRLPPEEAARVYYLTIVERRDLFGKHPFSLNLFSYPAPGSVGVVAQQAARKQINLAFQKLFPATKEGVYFNEILRNLIPILLDHPTFTIFQIEDFLLADPPTRQRTRQQGQNEGYRQQVLSDVHNPRISRYWQRFDSLTRQERREVADPFLRRLNELLDDEFIPYHIGLKKGELNIAEAIRQNKVLLFHLPLDHRAYADAAKVLGTLIIMQIYGATFGFDSNTRQHSFSLIVDEFSKWISTSGEDFVNLLQFGRQYGIRQVLGHQHTSQLQEEGLPTSLMDGLTGAGTVISLRTTLKDRTILAPLFANLGRPQQNLHRNVVKHLEDSTNPSFLKEFYWRVVKPMEQSLQQEDWRKYDFGFGATNYSSERVRYILDQLNEVLYTCELEGRIDETRLRHVAYEYLFLNDAVKLMMQKIDRQSHEAIEEAKSMDHSLLKTLPPERREDQVRRQMEYYGLCQAWTEVDDEMGDKIYTMFRNVCLTVIEDPLVAEEPDRALEEIENTLHQLPQREGFVKNGNNVYAIRTPDLITPDIDEIVAARWHTIIEQTKRKYCTKGREQISQEILASFSASVDDTQQHDTLHEYENLDDQDF